MPHCIALGCTSGYKSNSERVHFFVVPKDQNIVNLWRKAIRRKDFIIRSGQFLCEKHFSNNDILWKRELLDANGQVLGVSQYKQPRLRKGAIPSQFPWTEALEVRLIDQPSEDVSFAAGPHIEAIPVSKFCFADLIICKTLKLPPKWTRNSVIYDNVKIETFVRLKCIKTESSFITINLKELIVQENLKVKVNVLCKPLNESVLDNYNSSVNSTEEIEVKLNNLDSTKVCSGLSVVNSTRDVNNSTISYIDIAGTTRHINCVLLLVKTTSACFFCRRLKSTLRKRKFRLIKGITNERIRLMLSAEKQTKVIELKRKRNLALKAKKYSDARILKLKNDLKENQKTIAKMNSQTLEELLKKSNIGKNQSIAIKEILAHAKVKSKNGQKYSEEWMLLCMLMHIRSPMAYDFIRSNEILPLPCVRTIRRYLSIINTRCDFDLNFFELFKKYFQEKDDMERIGVILFDEIVTKESISVDSVKLTCKGLIDFSDEGLQSNNIIEKANHGLVLIFQSLYTKYTQPFAVFTSKSPVTGTNLAIIIMKAITLLEKAGARVYGIISGGGSSNRKLWKQLGVSGHIGNLKNFFQHPTEKRKVYVFSDAPHLIKTIRNRLYNNRTLQMNPAQQPIKWEYFEGLYNKEKNLLLENKICPKISKNHIILNSSSKMRVRLAVQIFSKSVAKGLRFYKKYYPKEFADCESTATFCEWINDVFDGLNRKDDGLTRHCTNFKVLEDALEQLDEWERKFQRSEISQNSFLTRQTAERLRITLKSTMDIVCYLTEECKFANVLTGRLNQDPLEILFGMIRNAGRSNDHSAISVFLQVYKILPTYSILKPPAYRN